MLQNIFSTKNNAEFKSALAHLYFNKELFKILSEKGTIYIWNVLGERISYVSKHIHCIYIFILKIQVYFFPSTDIEHAIISITYVLKFTQ